MEIQTVLKELDFIIKNKKDKNSQEYIHGVVMGVLILLLLFIGSTIYLIKYYL